MKKYLALRLAGLVPLFIGITFISFIVIHLAPGTPVGARSDLNPKMTAQARQKLEQLYGLDKPVHQQYLSWLKGITTLDFGKSFFDGEEVVQKIAKAIPVTLGLNLTALVLILIIGIPLGVAAAVNKDRPIDHAITGFSLAGLSFPSFWLALVLISLFAVHWRLLPASGLHSLLFEDKGLGAKLCDIAHHLLLPLVVASYAGIAVIS